MSLPLSIPQLTAICAAQATLNSVGLSAATFTPSTPSTSSPSSRGSTPTSSLPYSEVLAAHYVPPRSRLFTADEIACGQNKVNHETSVDHIVDHPLDMIVDYPETGDALDKAVTHVFSMCDDSEHFVHPRSNFQYSLGDGHGGRQDIVCCLLKSKSGTPVVCHKLRTSCKCECFQRQQ